MPTIFTTSTTQPGSFTGPDDSFVVMPGVSLVSTGGTTFAFSGITQRIVTVLGTVASGSATPIQSIDARLDVVVGKGGTVVAGNPFFSAILVNHFPSSGATGGLVMNDGSIIGGREAIAVLLVSPLSTLNNTGTITGGFSGATLQGLGAVVANSGTIAAGKSGLGNEGVTFAHAPGAHLGNTGLIEAQGNGDSTAVLAFGETTTLSVINDGVIRSPNGAGIVSLEGARLSVVNRGSIASNVGSREAISGGPANDVVVNTGTIAGSVALGEGKDLFDGRGGRVIGSVIGGMGDDLYLIDDPGIRIVEIAGDGGDTVQSAAGDFQLPEEVEVLELIGAAVGGAGNALANSIAGNALDNRLAGLGGNDTIAGGAGNDRIEGGEGNDVVFGEEGADEILGGEGSDSLVGGTGEDDLRGGDGFDTLRGGTGDDRLAGGLLGDQLFGEGGDDTLSGGSGFDTLEGGNNDDALFGGGGNDRLVGGNGADTLTGGAGADAFVFLAPSESAPATPDTIADFERGTDLIDLAGIDANTAVAGDQAFAFIGTAAFSAPGQVRFTAAGGVGRLEVNTVGNAGAEMVVLLPGLATLTAADFIL